VNPLTPSQSLWVEAFGRPGKYAPDLDSAKVEAMIDSLPDSREKLAVRLRFGFEGTPATLEEIGKRLPRADGTLGVSRETARKILAVAMRHLRRRRACWEAARMR